MGWCLLFATAQSPFLFGYENAQATAKSPGTIQPMAQQEIDSWLDDAYQSLNQTKADTPAPLVSSEENEPAPEYPKSLPPQPSVTIDTDTIDRMVPSSKDSTLPGGRVKMSGRYRVAAGVDSEDFILNDAHGDFQERNFRYLFGERQNNTYDPGIYSQYLLNVDFTPKDPWNFYTQLVADPWSWVGTTGEQVISNQDGTSWIRPNLKYFGAQNSVLNETFRATTGDAIATPMTKVIDGHTTAFRVPGFTDFGTQYTFPELEIDYEFRPIRKLWMDYTAENWHLRVFPLADETQALTSDDPLGLSNHKDYWQQSPWLYQYIPIQFFSDGSILRGYYSDSLSFLARDTEGNRLVLLRGASLEANLGRTYLAATVASPFTPWDEDYGAADNVAGAVRIKRRATDRLMVGGIYTFRNGLINNSITDVSQVLGIDAKYQINPHVKAVGEIAGSYRDMEMMTNDRLRKNQEGFAYKGAVNANFDHKHDGHTDFELSYTQMDKNFEPTLSRYSNTRDDHFWGNHITFKEYSPDMEHFRIGDGVDRDRMVLRARWKEKLFKDKFENLVDARTVYRTSNMAPKETVIRDEITYRPTRKLTTKGLFRWHRLPNTTTDIEPYIANFYFVGFSDPSNIVLQNVLIPPDVDPSRLTFSGGLQYALNTQWTAEAVYERTNDIPDFPRGLLNSSFRDANDRVDGLLLDHVTNLLYGQGPLGGVPPYEYFTIFRERLIFKPDPRVTFTAHAAQNSYRYASAIDDNVNHQGLSVALEPTKRLAIFADVTHSMQIDLPKLIASNYVTHDFADHLNAYASMDYRINAATVFRAEYGVFGFGTNTPLVTPYSTTGFTLPTIDTEHIFRVSLTGDF